MCVRLHVYMSRVSLRSANDSLCSCLVVFFFKQKTAYEMRISDWSSDVCSSDLMSLTVSSTGRARMRTRGVARTTTPGSASWGSDARLSSWPDRKSVVEGKSVSVRVDIGGRRIIKKKTKKATK